MPASYATLGSRQTVQVLTQTESADVEAVTIATQPSGIKMVVLVPLVQFEAGHADAYLTPPSELVEQLLAGGIVTQATYVQSTDASDLLAGFMRVTVSYTPDAGLSLPFTSQVLIPMTALVSLDAFQAWEGPEASSPLIVAYNRLVTLAGGPASDLLG